MLNIKGTKSFKEANDKTTACALMNLEDYSISTAKENNFANEKQIENCLYGDIPKEFRTKQSSQTVEKEDMTR